MQRTRTVVAPDGHTWRVTRRWISRYGKERSISRVRRRISERRYERKKRKRGDGVDWIPDALDLGDGCGVDALGQLLVVLLVIVAVVLFIMFVWPFVWIAMVAIYEILVWLVVLIAGAVARVVFRRPWSVDAFSDHGHALRWNIVGWRKSGKVRDGIAAALLAGRPLPDGETLGDPDTMQA